jgi:NTE family protein
MKECITFVLGGGGSRGALQIGAMKAFLENGIKPDLLVGTSIGAVNATGFALWGVNLSAIKKLEYAWKEIADAQILDPRISRLLVKIIIGYQNDRTKRKVEDYFISKGFFRELQFNSIPQVKLALISSDIETGQVVIYGKDPNDFILEGILSSIALPPWFTPYQVKERTMVDGGAFSNVPIEPALQLGATEIYALDLDDPSLVDHENHSISHNFLKYFYALSRRHVYLEMALAKAQGIPVHRITFEGSTDKPIWDFSDQRKLIRIGYETTKSKLAEWEIQKQSKYHANHTEL